MSEELLDTDARDAAFALAFDGQASPLTYERNDDAALAERIEPAGADPDARLAAVRATRALCEAAYTVAEWYRSGHLGDPPSHEAAMGHFARLAPGFTELQYDAALGAGLFWTR